MQKWSCFLACVLADANDKETESHEPEYPRETGDDAPVDLWAIDTPSSGKDISQRLDSVRLRQDVRDVAQVDWHTFHRPQHSTEQQIRVETAQG